MGQATAKMNVADLRKILGLSDDDTSIKSPDASTPSDTFSETTPVSRINNTGPGITERSTETSQRFQRVRRESMEQLHLIKVAAFFCLFLPHFVLFCSIGEFICINVVIYYVSFI